MKKKYFLYARKSTEDKERQVMSIEAQLAELADFAKRENLDIAWSGEWQIVASLRGFSSSASEASAYLFPKTLNV